MTGLALACLNIGVHAISLLLWGDVATGFMHAPPQSNYRAPQWQVGIVFVILSRAKEALFHQSFALFIVIFQ